MKPGKRKVKIEKQKRNNNVISRKLSRKQKRLEKKVIRRNKHSMKYNKNEQVTAGRYVKRPQNNEDVGDQPTKKTKQKLKTLAEQTAENFKKEKEQHEKLQSEMNKKRKLMLLEANEEEDMIIKKLEKRLGLKKAKNVNKMFEGDGLDYLLEVCDRSNEETIGYVEKHLANAESESDFDDDEAEVTGTERNEKQPKKKISKIDNISADVSIAPEDSQSDEDGESEINDDQYSYDTEDNSEESDDCNSDVKESNDSQEINNHSSSSKPDLWEDIYGRKRDKDGNLIKEESKGYVPPHLRNTETIKDDAEVVRLKREIKSVLNKLAESNMHWACNSIETLYSNHSRHSVNSSLSDLWMLAIIQQVTTTDRLICEHAALVSVLQANVGMEVGAHFLQVLVKRFNVMLGKEHVLENKELDNLICALAQLYNFKIYNASLLYEIMNKLLEDLSEKRVGCVIGALRCVGGVLRREEPLALKDFINSVQTRLATLTTTLNDGSRLKFLLDILMAIKNNNLNKIPNYDPSYSEHLKKITRGIIRRGNYVTTLNINLDDLLKADERGKWWVVGSAWEGSSTLEKKESQNVNEKPKYDKKLLDLARKQRMNTDVRRNIFCIIMTADDYMDAFEKLQHLGLKNQQEREIVHVLIACCLQENNYNPYYSVLGLKFCDFDRKYQLSIQYSIWDKIKDLNSLNKTQMGNLAKFTIHLIIEKGLPLSVLKVIEFSDLNKNTVKFMRQILLAIIMNEDFSATLEVFQRITTAPKLYMFRESLTLFMQHFLLKNMDKKANIINEKDRILLTDRVQKIENLMKSDSRVRL